MNKCIRGLGFALCLISAALTAQAGPVGYQTISVELQLQVQDVIEGQAGASLAAKKALSDYFFAKGTKNELQTGALVYQAGGPPQVQTNGITDYVFGQSPLPLLYMSFNSPILNLSGYSSHPNNTAGLLLGAQGLYLRSYLTTPNFSFYYLLNGDGTPLPPGSYTEALPNPATANPALFTGTEFVITFTGGEYNGLPLSGIDLTGEIICLDSSPCGGSAPVPPGFPTPEPPSMALSGIALNFAALATYCRRLSLLTKVSR